MVTLNPSKDSYVDDGAPGTNYGTYGTIYTSIVKLTTDIRRSLLEFSLVGLSGTPTTAVLRLNNNYVLNPRIIDFRRIDNNTWTEAGVTWNNQPSSTDFNIETTWNTTGWQTISVLSIVQQAITDGHNYVGILLKYLDESFDSNSHYNNCYAKETPAQKPELILTYGDKYVDIATGSDSDSGDTWADAYLTVKKGIDNVSSSVVLHIAEGNYSAQAAIDLNKNLSIFCEDYDGGNANPPLTVVLPVTV